MQSLEQKCSQLILENSDLQLKVQQLQSNPIKTELLDKERLINELNSDNERLKREVELLKTENELLRKALIQQQQQQQQQQQSQSQPQQQEQQQ
jgi:hypothetical protein